MDVLLAVIIVGLIVTAAISGRRFVLASDARKMRVLAELNGRDVSLGVAAGGDKVLHQIRGRLRITEDDLTHVVVSSETDVVVAVNRIRQITDVASGLRYGHWWRSEAM